MARLPAVWCANKSSTSVQPGPYSRWRRHWSCSSFRFCSVVSRLLAACSQHTTPACHRAASQSLGTSLRHIRTPSASCAAVLVKVELAVLPPAPIPSPAHRRLGPRPSLRKIAAVALVVVKRCIWAHPPHPTSKNPILIYPSLSRSIYT